MLVYFATADEAALEAKALALRVIAEWMASTKARRVLAEIAKHTGLLPEDL